MKEFGQPRGEVQTFRARQFWNSNICGAAVGGAGIGIVMLVVMGIVVSENPTLSNIAFATGLALVLMASAICFLPGNLIAAYPYAVTLEDGRGLELHTAFKKIYIPTEDLQDVRKSLAQPGYVVRLKRRHRLLKSFLIPSFFGDQAEPLANAIREEIQRRASSSE
jgi:hypothetical protein